MAPPTSIPTRASLLARLRTGDDVEGWQEFYQTYGGLLRAFALKAGLTESEAEEVVQDTAIGVARGLAGFRYDPAACAFKTWMLNLAQWRITDALRRRGATPPPGPRRHAEHAEHNDRTPLIERIPDPHVVDFGQEWDRAWEQHLREAALERVRRAVNPRHFQIFDLYVLKGRPAREVAARTGVVVAQVYLVKQRLGSRLRQEMRRLEARELQGLGERPGGR